MATVALINNSKVVVLPAPPTFMGNVSMFSEDIAKYIINKLISLAITSHHITNVEHNIPQYCFTFTKQTLNTIMASQHICYDKDDYKSQCISHIDNSLANIPPIEHKESKNSFIPHNNFNLDAVFYNNFYHGDNNWETTSEPTTTEVDRYASSMITYNKTNMNEDHHSKNDEDDKRNTLLHKRTSKVLTTINRNIENVAEGGAKKKKGWYEIMNEMSAHDIPWEDNEDQIKQDKEFEELRKEKENEIKVKEHEKKLKLKEEKEVQIKKKEELNKQNKYKNKKITIDANGNVIIIKPFDMDILAKDFISIRSNSKNVKRMQPPKAVALHKPQQHKKQLPVIETSNQSLPFPQQSKTVYISSNLEKKLERGPVVPSGSCFDKMKPEIGVCITEDKRSKTGGKDFFKKFNKYSLENYTKQLQSNLSANMTYTGNSNNNLAFTQSNYMMNSDFHNRTLTDMNNYNTIGSSFIKKNPLSKTNNFFVSSNINMNHSAYNPLIKLSTTNQFNLKGTLDDLNLISEQEENANANVLNRTNIFKQTSQTITAPNYKTPQLTDMNKFASGFIKGDAYTKGNNSSTRTHMSNYAMKPSKPKQTDIEREIGKSTLTTYKRLPRMRGIMSKTFHNN